MPNQPKINAYGKNEATNWQIPNYWDLIAIVLVFTVIIILAWGTKQMLKPYHVGQVIPISLAIKNLPHYALRTILRLFIAMTFSLIFTFTIGTFAAKNKHAERLLIPIIDILQSLPVLFFLSITITAFIVLFNGSMLGVECASIFAVFTSQVWNMTLSFYQSMRTVPQDLREAARMFRLNAWQKFWRVEVPFAMPGLLWNMMMSMSGSWFFVTASEALSVANSNITLPGIGSYISLAISQANIAAIVYAIITMLLVIILYDQLLFRPLVYWCEKFKAEQDEDAKDISSTSLVVTIFQKTKFLQIFSKWLDLLGEFFINPPFFRSAKTSIIKSPKTSHTKFFITLYYIILGIAVLIGLLFITKFIYTNFTAHEIFQVFLMGIFTALRVFSLIIISSLIWLPVGVWIGLRPKVAEYIQPLIQFLAAFPANLFFPVAAMLFLKFKLNVEIWVAPLMVLGTQWYILFNVIAGASALPKDLKQAAAMLKVKGFLRWRKLILPGIAPFFITGAITAAGGAWNASIVAEVINWGSIKLQATGLGTYIANNTSSGDITRVVLGTIIMGILVLLINRLIWRPLYNIAVERYNIET